MAAVVPAESIPNAISVVTVVQMAGEVLAPLLFALVSGSPSLAPAFLLAALAYAPAALLPLTIRAEGRAEGAAAATAQGGRAAVASLVEGLRYILDHPLLPGLYALDWGLTLFTFYRELVRLCPLPPLTPCHLPSNRPSTANGDARASAIRYTRACLAAHAAHATYAAPPVARRRVSAWPLTPRRPCRRARAQFPYFVASLFTTARLGMSARQAAAALTIANYVGGTVGSSATLLFNAYPYKGRAVCLATLAYGAFAAAIGCSSLLPVGMAAVCLCGAFDAVGCAASGLEPQKYSQRGYARLRTEGPLHSPACCPADAAPPPLRMTFRKTVVLITTPDHLRGRAQAGHSLAANVANALGQMYVAAMGAAFGLPLTMGLGAALTWAAVGVAVWRIPKLWSYKDAPEAGDGEDSAMTQSSA